MANAIMKNNGVYDFETYAPSILGTGFKRVEILGHMPYVTAIVLDQDLNSRHAEIFSLGTLPTGTPNDARQYDYYRVKKMDGSIVMIGEAWIDVDSIVESDVKNAVVTIKNVTASDMTNVRTALVQAGLSDFEIKFV